MYFPISGSHISPIYLAIVGFVIGILGGFFGVGGSFIAGPALRAVGLDWNFAVGTDLAHIVGKSVVAAKRHRALGNVDLKLGLIMAVGTIGGAEVGAQLIELLKRRGNVNLVVSVVSIAIYFSISSFMMWEARKTILMHRKKKVEGSRPQSAAEKDRSAFHGVTKSIQRFHLPPMISLPVSGVESISLWIILFVAFVGGVFSGFLGGGAGYIRMPSMVYVLGIPTHLAVGTDRARALLGTQRPFVPVDRLRRVLEHQLRGDRMKPFRDRALRLRHSSPPDTWSNEDSRDRQTRI